MTEKGWVPVVVNGHAGRVEAGTSLLMAAYRLGARLYFPCGGQAACSLCRVKVLQGMESLSPESRFMTVWRGAHGSVSPRVRLACQTRVLGPGPVVVEGVFSKR